MICWKCNAWYDAGDPKYCPRCAEEIGRHGYTDDVTWSIVEEEYNRRTPESAGGDAETVTVLYASVLRRFQAVITDSVVYVAVWLLVIVLGTAAASIAPIGGVFLILWVGFVLLYEPVSVSRFGGTLGHRFNNLCVVSDQTGGNVSFGAAVVRFLIKVIFGWLSFTLILLTRRRQALHDLWTLSTVQIRDAEAARQHHFVAVEETLPNAAEPAGEGVAKTQLSSNEVRESS